MSTITHATHIWGRYLPVASIDRPATTAAGANAETEGINTGQIWRDTFTSLKVDWKEICREGKSVGRRAGQIGKRTDNGQCINAKAERLDVSSGDRIGVRGDVAIEVPYPLIVVVLVINARGTMGRQMCHMRRCIRKSERKARTRGYLAMAASYTMKPTRSTRPKTNVMSTVAELRGVVTPPHVNVIVTATALPIMRKLPLSAGILVSPILCTV